MRADSVRGQVVLLTGAGGGLGRHLASALANLGARLFLVDVNPAALADVGGRLDAHVFAADLADDADREELLRRCVAELGAPEVLINCAGTEKVSEYVKLSADEIRRALDVNLLSTVLLTRSVLPYMLRRGRGHVITVGSLAGLKPVPFNAVYNTAKAGLVAFSLSLTKELEGSGVHATVICPSGVRDAGMWARPSGQLAPNRLVQSSTVAPGDVVDAVMFALIQQRPRVLVASALVRLGALLSFVSPRLDRVMDRVSHLADVYRQRIVTDRDNRL